MKTFERVLSWIIIALGVVWGLTCAVAIADTPHIIEQSDSFIFLVWAVFSFFPPIMALGVLAIFVDVVETIRK